MTYNKYGAHKTEVDGYTFASKAEARRYGELRLMEMAGEIMALTVHPRFPLAVNGIKVGVYVADFGYLGPARSDGTRTYVVEDVKGVRTPVYALKKKLVKALYGDDIVEVEA